MTVKKIITSALVAGMTLSWGASKAVAGEIRYRDSDSGTFASSTLDSDGDGAPGTTGQGIGKSTKGKTTHYFFSEYALLPVANINCPDGTTEFPAVRARSVRRFSNGDLLVNEINPGAGIGSGFTCVDFATGTFTSTAKGEWTGGTGKFANATGPVTVLSNGTVLVFDSMGAIFGSFESSASGTIILP